MRKEMTAISLIVSGLLITGTGICLCVKHKLENGCLDLEELS